MINVTLTITGNEWMRLRDAAERAFPNELLSRAEITRRFALAGVQATKCLTEGGAKQQAHELRSSQYVAGSEGDKPRISES
jgi:hypothetical protein